MSIKKVTLFILIRTAVKLEPNYDSEGKTSRILKIKDLISI